MLGKLAFLYFTLATAANAATTADRLNVDAQIPCGIDDRRAFLEPSTLAGWHEQDERFVGFVGLFQHAVFLVQPLLAARPPRRRPPVVAFTSTDWAPPRVEGMVPWGATLSR